MYAIFIFSLVFVSGFSVMAIELLGGRMLAPWFGSSIYVWGSIITVFMLALSLGYLGGGQWSLRSPSLRRLGALFLLAALTVLPVVSFSDPLMNWIFQRINDPRYGSLLAALCLFLLPTLVMGMISPYAVRLLVRSQHASGQVAGKLYFISTAGSALGTLLTSFYLVLYFDVNAIVGAISAALAAGGLAALLGQYLIKGGGS